MIDFERKIVVIHPPRCAGTTLEKSLYNKDYFKISPLLKHRNIKEYKVQIRGKGFSVSDFKWYGLIRNPVERVISMYHCHYWHEISGISKKSSLVRFCALLKPAIHEGTNLSLCDYYNDNITIEILNYKDVSDLVYKIDSSLKIQLAERKNRTFTRISLLADIIIYNKFKNDFKRFNFYPFYSITKYIHRVAPIFTTYITLSQKIRIIKNRVL